MVLVIVLIYVICVVDDCQGGTDTNTVVHM